MIPRDSERSDGSSGRRERRLRERRLALSLRTAIDELLALGVVYLVEDEDGRRFELTEEVR